jgi:arginine deiminase
VSEGKLTDQLLELPLTELARVLIEGYENPKWDGRSDDRYLLNPLYNILFTRDASSTIYNKVLINSMSFEVRERESLIFDTIFKHCFKVETMNASLVDSRARTEGGDVQIASPDLLCLGYGIRTNSIGIEYLADTFAKERKKSHILVQELPLKPESFIHLDMVFTFLGQHHCMAFEPMLKKQGLFANKDTTLITIDNGRIKYRRVNNILEGLRKLGWEMDPVLCGGSDSWVQLREQWHSGANFFALGDNKVMGYRRNTHTIDALDKAGFTVLQAEDIVSGKISMNDYEKFVAVFPGSELPRAGGGARCMTMPILRED